jgi:UDPglucose--hexose-1-phosphate uridylyltransferase
MVDPNLPHRRYNPLTNEWILVSPHRNKRPWNGAVEKPSETRIPFYDPNCYLCPNNTRASGKKNPDYKETFVFTNDHASLLANVGNGETSEENLLIARQENGTSRVICYSPSHNRSMANLTVSEIQTVIKTWIHEYEAIGAYPDISYIQIFENKGPLMGASSPHPHCQIWANEHIPTIPEKEQNMQKKHPDLLLEYEKLEQQKKERVIFTNDSFTLLVPYWATWPYETMLLPKKHLSSLSEFSESEITDLANILSLLTKTYDKIFNVAFPYSMGIHQAPTDKLPHPEWQFHMHFYPPLLRSATVKKHFVGYEMMAEAQRDITPEAAAETLRRCI